MKNNQKKIVYHWFNKGLRNLDDGELDSLFIDITQDEIKVEFGQRKNKIIKILNRFHFLEVIDKYFQYYDSSNINTEKIFTRIDGYIEYLVIKKKKFYSLNDEVNICELFLSDLNKVIGFDLFEPCQKMFKEYLWFSEIHKMWPHG